MRSQVFWLWLFAASAVFCGLLAAIWRKIRSHCISVGATVVVGAVALWFQPNLADLPEPAVIDALERCTGDRKIAEEVARSALGHDVWYSPNIYEVDLSYLTTSYPTERQWTEEDGKTYLRVIAKSTTTIHNLAKQADPDYKHEMASFHLTAHGEGIGDFIYDNVVITVYNRNGVEQEVRRLSNHPETGEEDLAKYAKVIHPTADSAVLEVGIRLEPEGYTKIETKTRSYEAIDNGEIAFMTRKRTVDMKLSAVFPNHSYEHFDHAFIFVYKRCHEAGAAKVCPEIANPSEGKLEARINGGILSYNGIILRWMKKQ